ncbi:transposase [Streptomyces olivaceoviridis]|uniref:transposase n=1 Tax=Streptomyces olivaceoviridis TaxID=1921 RepID=UPI0037933729
MARGITPARRARSPTARPALSLHLASDAASAAVDWRLFLSESWDDASPKTDPAKVARHAKFGTPEEVGHVEEWQLTFGPNRRDEVVSPRGPARHCQRRLRCCILPPRLGRTLP